MKRTCCHITILFILLGIFQDGHAQYAFWDTGDGLSNEWISQITQDKDGFIWVATQNGLNKFDGYTFKNFYYEADQTNGLRANWVREMVQDSAGLLWLGLYVEGVAVFDPFRAEVLEYARTEDSTGLNGFRKLLVAKNHAIWCGGTNGLYVKQAKSKLFEAVFDEMVFDVQEDAQGNIFAVTRTAIYRFAKDSWIPERIVELENQHVRRLFFDSQDQFWLLGKNDIFQIKNQNKEWQFSIFSKGKNTITSRYFLEAPIFEDKAKQLWIGGETSLTIISPDRLSVRQLLYEDIYPKGKPAGRVSCFFEDQHNNIWIGTTRGLLLQSPLGERFKTEYSIPHLDEFEEARELLQIGNYFWISTVKGLYRISISEPESPPIKVIDQQIFSLLAASDGNLYGGSSVGLYIVDTSSLASTFFQTKATKDGLQGGAIWSMVEDRAGKIWIGSVGLLQRLDPGTMTYTHFDKESVLSLNGVSAQDLLIDSKGRLWAGSLYSGVYLLENPHNILQKEEVVFKRFNYEPGNANSLSHKVVLFLAEGKDGAIWVATDGGLNRIDDLHRKLKALTNQSASHFIRRIRLQKARNLLQTSALNVSEVAYEVGFSDPAYFSRLYSEVFGEAPSVTRK